VDPVPQGAGDPFLQQGSGEAAGLLSLPPVIVPAPQGVLTEAT
jgi:hypothetical protein